MSEKRNDDDRQIKLDPMEWEHVNPSHKPTKQKNDTMSPSDDKQKKS